MATARFVVNAALRKIGVLAAGREARLADATDALAALQGMHTSWVASGAFGRLEDVVPTGTTFTARGGERIYRQDAETLSVTLPELVSDGWVNDFGHDRRGYYGTIITVTDGDDGSTIVDVKAGQPLSWATTPRDGSAVVISDAVGGETRTWLYDGTIKKWQGVEALILDDEAPRSSADPQGLAACLAMEIAGDYSREIPPSAIMQATRYKAALTQRFGMRREQNYQPEAYY